MKILIVTVGGSPQPILTAIKSIQPDRVVFICSDGPKGSLSQVIGEGKPCKIIEKGVEKEALPNITVQAGLGDRFDRQRDIIIVDPDELCECHSRIREYLTALKSNVPHASFKADYTGGTKTMTAALVMAAIDCGIELFLTTGKRDNIIKVDHGESTEKVSLSQITLERNLEIYLPELLENFDYGTATCRLQSLLNSLELSKEQKKSLRSLLNCCQAFDCWDRFEHRGALELLSPLLGSKEILPLGMFLKRIITSRAVLDESYDTSGCKDGHGYEVVEDLILNAERRARQKRFDDAVGRLYRALELCAQIRLKKDHRILTGAIGLSSLPDDWQEKYRSQVNEKGILQFGLRSSYELLAARSDPAGLIYREHSGFIIDALSVRNNSLFAHGFRPISEADYRKVNSTFTSFIGEVIEKVTGNRRREPAVQFPTRLGLSIFLQGST